MQWLVIVLLVAGGGFSALAGVGILRMPDVYMRIQASTKAGSLGVGCLFLAVVLHFSALDVTTRAMLVVGFIFLTAPVAGHMIGRAAYHVGVPMWKHAVLDELKDRFDPATQTLAGLPRDQAGGRRPGDDTAAGNAAAGDDDRSDAHM
jgi:multicomponent Na+:H+ antiporter subunit G